MWNAFFNVDKTGLDCAWSQGEAFLPLRYQIIFEVTQRHHKKRDLL